MWAVQESELDIFVSLDIRVDDGEARSYLKIDINNMSTGCCVTAALHPHTTDGIST